MTVRARVAGAVGAALIVVLAGCSSSPDSATPTGQPSGATPTQSTAQPAPSGATPTQATGLPGPSGATPTQASGQPGTPVPTTDPGAPVTSGQITLAPSGPATTVVSVVAVTAAGQPSDGFTVVSPDPYGALDCKYAEPSRSGNTPGIYSGCGASADSADVCWAPPGNTTLLCASDPWQRTLRRYTVTPQLTPVGRTESPEPWALELADGRHCRIRVGGAWGGRSDGLVGAYSCDGGHDVVLQPANARTAVDTSSSTWTVKVGPLGSGNPDFPPPPAVAVRTAYFAATAG
ncbi:hypothetical protein [Nocardia sp. NPDC051833]|uniref:hypothetical protein n=1 Tax=Nocardia sp. NPDC051833 TaxID=3155674 RepID=UPI00341C15F8